jgi:uroporphyrinogen-III synthase
MRRILVLRPEPGASATARKIRGLGLEAIVVPLFEIDPLAWEAPDPSRFDGLLLTSAQAPRVGGEELRRLRGLKVYAVGEATAEAARAAGFDIAATGEAGVEQLLGAVGTELRLLHLCGEDRRALDGAAQSIRQVVVYRSRAIETPDLRGISGSVALIHSPRAGRRLAELVDDRSSIALAAISAAAADAAGHGWESSRAAQNSTDDALLALAARLCNNPPPE